MPPRFNHLPLPEKLEELASLESEIRGRRYVTPDGIELPSVTTVLSVLSRDSIRQWRERVGAETANRISREAATRGTAIHLAAERCIDNEENPGRDLTEADVPLYNQIEPWLDSFVDNVRMQERSLYSLDLGIAGKPDCIAEWDGVPSVIDFKTSKKPKKRSWIENYFMQGTAYCIMWEELTGEPIRQIVILIAVEHQLTPQVFVARPSEWIGGLRAAIAAWQLENNGKQPNSGGVKQI